jgi:ribosome-binding protein aMBF1 (putative translation factor)
METKSWTKIKDDVYGLKGTSRRDELDRNYESFKIGLLLRQARENKKMSQAILASKVDKKENTFLE